MKAIFSVVLIGFVTVSGAQNHSMKNIRMMVEQEHDHIATYESSSVRVKMFNASNEVLYEANLFNGTELDETFFYYNDADELDWERAIFHDNAESGIIEFEYNEEGLLIEEAEFNHKHELLYRNTMNYDKAGKMIEKQREVKRAGETELVVESNFSYTYDPMGRVLKQDGFENGKPETRATYQFWYDNGGLTQTKERLDVDGAVVERWVEVYTADDHKTSYVHSVYRDGKEVILTDVAYTYSDHGDILTETVHKEGKLVDEIIFKYTYDNHGNWTTKKEFKGLGVENKEEVMTIQRWIEYYEKDEYSHAPMELDEQFTVEINPETQKHVHVSAETHVRINNNAGQVVWQVRRNGSDIFQADYNQYVGGVLIQSKHLNNYKKANYYTNYTFNGNGTPALEETYSFDGVLNEKVTYTYNETGLLTKKDEHFADPTGAMNVEITEVYTYNKTGKVTKTEVTEYGEKYSVEYVYNSEGNIMAKTQTPDNKTEPPYVEQYSYDNGLLTGKDIFEGKAKEPSENDEFEYNNKGELVKSSFYEKGQLREVTLYEYFD